MFSENQEIFVPIIKAGSMIFMFTIVVLIGNLPLRMKAFKSNKTLLAYMSAFSGGLFFSVGILHLLPESSESYEAYYEENNLTDQEHFPWPSFIVTLTFALILFIEKIGPTHSHIEHEHPHSNSQRPKKIQIPDQDNQLLNSSNQSEKSNKGSQQNLLPKFNECHMEQEQHVKDTLNTQVKIAKQIGQVEHQRKQSHDSSTSTIMENVDKLAPYILQIAIGIHAVFEGLAIGVQVDLPECIGITLAVACHKWAEALTLGVAFRHARIDLKTSTIMIFLQAIMNPIGIGLGWYLSSYGVLVTGIFQAISAGTFIYIATMEILVEEFNMQRNKFGKYFIFLIAIAFVASIWFLEQLTE